VRPLPIPIGLLTDQATGHHVFPERKGSVMPQIPPMDDRRYVVAQYRTASNLQARMALHQQFSTNPYGWLRWVFDQFRLPLQCRLVELGGGTGDLWVENQSRIPTGWAITLSDASMGMVSHARQRLRASAVALTFAVVDAQALPFATASIDAVIANHLLYHVPDHPRALAEIQRVLKPGGRLYASTVGQRHLAEMAELVGRFDARLASWREPSVFSFTLENGADLLGAWFHEVALARYEDGLLVTEAAPLVDYLLSGRLQLTPEEEKRFRAFVARELRCHGGALAITKDSGLFAAIRQA
jgi:SAM-dependent methyltransferase